MTGHNKHSDTKVQHSQIRQQARIWEECDSCGARLHQNEEVVCSRCLRLQELSLESALDRFSEREDAEFERFCDLLEEED